MKPGRKAAKTADCVTYQTSQYHNSIIKTEDLMDYNVMKCVFERVFIVSAAAWQWMNTRAEFIWYKLSEYNKELCFGTIH